MHYTIVNWSTIQSLVLSEFSKFFFFHLQVVLVKFLYDMFISPYVTRYHGNVCPFVKFTFNVPGLSHDPTEEGNLTTYLP